MNGGNDGPMENGGLEGGNGLGEEKEGKNDVKAEKKAKKAMGVGEMEKDGQAEEKDAGANENAVES